MRHVPSRLLALLVLLAVGASPALAQSAAEAPDAEGVAVEAAHQEAPASGESCGAEAISWSQGQDGFALDQLNNAETDQTCCKICRKGKACGDTCIKRTYTCRKAPGCACNADDVPSLN